MPFAGLIGCGKKEDELNAVPDEVIEPTEQTRVKVQYHFQCSKDWSAWYWDGPPVYPAPTQEYLDDLKRKLYLPSSFQFPCNLVEPNYHWSKQPGRECYCELKVWGTVDYDQLIHWPDTPECFWAGRNYGEGLKLVKLELV